jgi:hypothetical protein
VTALDGTTPAAHPVGEDRIFSRDSIERTLVDAAVRAGQGRTCSDLDRVPVLGRHAGLTGLLRRGALLGDAWADAIPVELTDRLDADAVAARIVGRYQDAAYPAVVLGSPHGAAVHLAAAMRAAWLPTTFSMNVHWPQGRAGDWDGALAGGIEAADRILRANPGVTVRQVHDPVRRGWLCGSTLTLHVRWRRLPAAYRTFLKTRLHPGGGVLVLRDGRIWPVLAARAGHTFQLGSPSSGWTPGDYTPRNRSFTDLVEGVDGTPMSPARVNPPCHYAEFAGEPGLENDVRGTVAETHRVLYADPHGLSAAVADLYRDWFARDGRGGERCIVETERLLDPGQVLSAGLVPYWCESASRPAVAAAERWLAGSRPYDLVDVLPAPPGTACDAHAEPGQWRALAWFARRMGRVDREGLRRYPLLPLPTSHAAALMQRRSRADPPPGRLSLADVLADLRRSAGGLGLIVA